MSDFKKPSEVVIQLHGGEIVQELSASEELLTKWKANTYRGSQILDIEPQRWNVPGWVPSDSLTAVYAAPGVGKSFYALSLAIECARGGEWVGTRLEPVPVLYVAAERLTTLRDRAEAWSERSEEPLPSNLLLPKFSATPQLTNSTHIEALCAFIESEGVRFVVLDTYAMMTQGIDENSSQYVGTIMEALSQLRQATRGGSVMVVHHSGKDSSKGLRGSTAFLAAVDLSIEIASGGNGRISATVRKSNAGAMPMPEWYELETVPLSPLDGESRSSAVLIPTGAPRKDEALELMVIEVLEGCSSGSMSAPQIRAALLELGRECSPSHLDRTALKPMLNRGAVTVEGKARATRYSLPSGSVSVSNLFTP
jgi:hypothetical protein